MYLVRLVRATVGDSGLCCCGCQTSFERYLINSLFAGLTQGRTKSELRQCSNTTGVREMLLVSVR